MEDAAKTFSKILIPYDASPHARQALQFVAAPLKEDLSRHVGRPDHAACIGYQNSGRHAGQREAGLGGQVGEAVTGQVRRDHPEARGEKGQQVAPAAHRRIGTYPEGTIRVGVGPFNTEADVDALVQAVRISATS